MTDEFSKALTKLDAARTNAEWNETRARVVALYEAAVKGEPREALTKLAQQSAPLWPNHSPYMKGKLK